MASRRSYAREAMQIAPILWICIALFFLRVIGQVEVLLLEPAWLPPMSAFYSGLLPYPILLPLQVALLMLMCVLALRQSTVPGSRIWRQIAFIYFAIMAARLAWCVSVYGRDFYLHGGIPVAFHWVLALFLVVWARDRQAGITVTPSAAAP
jgi:hypothetical protein